MFLFAFFLTNDKVWFRKTFDLNYEKIRNFLFYRFGDIEKAEDLTQDVFIKLWENRKKIETGKEVPYLYKVASNLFNNQYKREKLHLEFVNTNDAKINTETPQYLLELKEFDIKLQEAISNLPETCRTIFLMNRIDKLTYAEIAEIRSVSVKAIEKQMHKALTLLKTELKVKV